MDALDLQYGDFLRASPLKSRRHTASSDLKEEQRPYQVFCNTRMGAIVSVKLAFNDNVIGSGF